MRRILISTVVTIVLLAGCRGLLQRGLPQASSLPIAHHVRVEQLVIHSDFEVPRDHRLVRELVAERDDVCQTLGLPPSDEFIEVYLFRDADTYRRYLDRHFPSVPSRRAFFVETDTRLSVYAHWSDRVAEDLRHEVAHGYLHSIVAGLPLWLDEGLAEFFEVPRGRNGFNRPHLDLVGDMMREGWRPDLGKLERLTDAAQLQQLDYAESWAWVYFLLHSDPERRELLTGYLADLRADGVSEPLSRRLADRGIKAEHILGEFLAGLDQATKLR
jgi:Protein of unknown function (DUF1570)